MHIALTLVALVAIVTVVGGAARWVGAPAPLILTAVGVAGSFVPFTPQIELTSELVLVGLLPPLLYAAALRTSLVDFRRNARAIALLSVGLVLFTTAGIGLLTWWVLPVPLAAAVALGAVVAPPDAVAATSIARRIGMPRRIVTDPGGGVALVDDATAMVCLRTAIAASAGSSASGGGRDLLSGGRRRRGAERASWWHWWAWACAAGTSPTRCSTPTCRLG